jgi:hypothetical protein
MSHKTYNITYLAAETFLVPLFPKSLQDHIDNRLPASSTFAAESTSMATDTPCEPIFFDKGCARVERIPTLGTKEMAHMPLATTSNNHLAFDWRLT